MAENSDSDEAAEDLQGTVDHSTSLLSGLDMSDDTDKVLVLLVVMRDYFVTSALIDLCTRLSLFVAKLSFKRCSNFLGK